MNSHELAKILLSAPDMPIATHAMGQTYMSENHDDSVCVAVLRTCYGKSHMCIGNMNTALINGSNWRITSVVHGNVSFAPQKCSRFVSGHWVDGYSEYVLGP